MFRNGLAILYLLVMSLLTSTVVHAQEFSGTAQLECSGEIHPEQREQPSSGDSDKTVAHHHGCHSVSAFLGGSEPLQPSLSPGADDFPLMPVSALFSRASGPDLRPPIA